MDRVAYKKFERLLTSHGLTIARGTKHLLIQRNGATVGSVAHSPTVPNMCYRRTVQLLVRDGHLPVEAKRIKF